MTKKRDAVGKDRSDEELTRLLNVEKERLINVEKELMRRFDKQLSEKFKREWPFDRDTVIELLNQNAIDTIKQFFPYVAKIFDMKEDELKPYFSELGMDGSPTINAYLRQVYGGFGARYHLKINFGFIMFIHMMVEVFASRIEPKIHIDETVRVAKRLMDAYCKDNLLATKGFESTQLSDFQIYCASALDKYAQRFIIAHELGHFILGLGID